MVVSGVIGAVGVAQGQRATERDSRPAENPALAACLDEHRDYCPVGAPGLPPTVAAPSTPRTKDEAVQAALSVADPTAKPTQAFARAVLMTLGDYEKAAHGGEHVNASVDQARLVWVVTV